MYLHTISRVNFQCSLGDTHGSFLSFNPFHRVIRISVWHRIEPGVRHPGNPWNPGCFEGEFATVIRETHRWTMFFGPFTLW